MPPLPHWGLFRPIVGPDGRQIDDAFLRYLQGIQNAAEAAQPAGSYQSALTPQPIADELPTDGTATVDDLAAAFNSVRAALIVWGIAT